MSKDFVKELIHILIAIILAMIAVKFIIWLLPIILIGLCSYYIYKSNKKNKTTNNKNQTKNKPIKIIDMVDEE